MEILKTILIDLLSLIAALNCFIILPALLIGAIINKSEQIKY